MTRVSLAESLEALLADSVAEIANAGLGLDPVARARLAALDGRRLQISVLFPGPVAPSHLTLRIDQGRLRLVPGACERPDAEIRGNPPALAGWLFSGAPGDGDTPAIGGDESLLRELAALLREYRPELGPPLERALGPGLADTVIGAAELLGAGLRSLAAGALEGLRQTAGDRFVDRPLAARFVDDLDDLQRRIERLQGRLGAEEARRTPQ